MQVHKQYIANLNFIKEIHPLGSGRYHIQLNDSEDTLLPVGRKFGKDVIRSIKNTKNAVQEKISVVCNVKNRVVK